MQYRNSYTHRKNGCQRLIRGRCNVVYRYLKNSDGKTGGFGIETLSKDDKILKISYSGGIDIYTEKTYYYKSSKLIYAILEISNREQKSLFIKHEIYKDEEIISSRIVKNILKIEDTYTAEFSLHKDGLEIFESESNIR